MPRDHSRGAPDRTSPGLSAVETTPFALAPAGGGGPALVRTGWLQMVSALGAWSAAAPSTVGERIQKGTAARPPPWRRRPAPVSGRRSGWSIIRRDCVCLLPAGPDAPEQKLPRPRDTPHYDPSQPLKLFYP